jgi:hypothetical protein
MVQRYLTSEAGSIGFRQWLIKHGYTSVMNPQEVRLNNKHFHYIIKTDQESFYCLFKHDFFYTFPDKYKLFFDKYPSLNSAGESINFDKLIFALNNNMTLIFIYENGSFYEIKPQEILNVHVLAKEFYPDGFIREQKKINTYTEQFVDVEFNERTISFPLKSMSRRLE